MRLAAEGRGGSAVQGAAGRLLHCCCCCCRRMRGLAAIQRLLQRMVRRALRCAAALVSLLSLLCLLRCAAQVWDLGGQTSIRPYWRCYYP